MSGHGAMTDPRPVVEPTMQEVRIELVRWQEAGLAGEPRTDTERDRVAALWARVDADHREEGRWR